MATERPSYGAVLWQAMWQHGFIIVPEPDKGWAGLSPGDANDYDMVADAVATAVLADMVKRLEALDDGGAIPSDDLYNRGRRFRLREVVTTISAMRQEDRDA